MCHKSYDLISIELVTMFCQRLISYSRGNDLYNILKSGEISMLLQLLEGKLQQRLTLIYIFNQQALKSFHVAAFNIIRTCWTVHKEKYLEEHVPKCATLATMYTDCLTHIHIFVQTTSITGLSAL